MCEYCKGSEYLGVLPYGDTQLFVDIVGSSLRIFDEEYPGFLEEIEIKCCPVCGKKLPEERQRGKEE